MHPGGFDRMIQYAYGVIDLLDKAPPGFSQADASRVAVKEHDAKVFLQRPDSFTHARFAGAECLCRAMKAEMLGDG